MKIYSLPKNKRKDKERNIRVEFYLSYGLRNQSDFESLNVKADISTIVKKIRRSSVLLFINYLLILQSKPNRLSAINLTLQRGVTGTARMLHALTHSSISRQVREQM